MITELIVTLYFRRNDDVSSDLSDSEDSDDLDSDVVHEELFYWREVEVNVATWVVEPNDLLPSSLPPMPIPSASLTSKAPSSPPQPQPTAVTPQTQITPVGVPPPPQPQPPLGQSQPAPPHYIHVSSPPTLSHMDMARPPHEGRCFFN